MDHCTGRFPSGVLAQLGARNIRIVEATGSNPVYSRPRSVVLNATALSSWLYCCSFSMKQKREIMQRNLMTTYQGSDTMVQHRQKELCRKVWYKIYEKEDRSRIDCHSSGLYLLLCGTSCCEHPRKRILGLSGGTGAADSCDLRFPEKDHQHLPAKI